MAPARWGSADTWLITRYEDVFNILQDKRFTKTQRTVQTPEQARKRPWVPGFARPLESNLLDQDDPNHARLRALVHKAFTPQRIELLEPRIQHIADDLLNVQLAKGSMDLVRDYALPLPLTVIAEMLGVPVVDRAQFSSWTNAFLRAPSSLNMLRMLPAVRSLINYSRQAIAERRIHPKDDLLTALIQAEEQGEHLSEEELLAMVFLLLIAGHETTVNLISVGALALLEHPDQMQLLATKPEITKSAIEELLRYTSPVETATERYAREDMVLEGETIRKGELVLAVIASANRDERVFAHPDELDLTREKNRHLAFGFGIHFCLGAPLARMEGQIALPTLLHRMPNLRLAVPVNKLRWRATPTVHGLQALPVAFDT